jgi:hypothetical protein
MLTQFSGIFLVPKGVLESSPLTVGPLWGAIGVSSASPKESGRKWHEQTNMLQLNLIISSK